MAQTKFLRHIISLSIRERLRLAFRGSIAISATIYADRVDDVKAAPFDGDTYEADAWIKTGRKDGLPHPERWQDVNANTARMGRSSIKRVS